MFLFIRLITAHFVGDFLLQTSGVYKAKISKGYGLYLHVFLIFLSMIIILLPVLDISLFALTLGISLFHLIVDSTKLKLNRIIPKKFIYVGFLVDQILHITSLTSAFYLNHEHRYNYIFSLMPHKIQDIYTNNSYFIVATVIILITFVTEIFIFTLESSFSSNPQPKVSTYSSKTIFKFTGNTLTMLAYLFYGLDWKPILISLLILLFYLFALHRKDKYYGLLSIITSIILGLLAKGWI